MKKQVICTALLASLFCFTHHGLVHAHTLGDVVFTDSSKGQEKVLGKMTTDWIRDGKQLFFTLGLRKEKYLHFNDMLRYTLRDKVTLQEVKSDFLSGVGGSARGDYLSGAGAVIDFSAIPVGDYILTVETLGMYSGKISAESTITWDGVGNNDHSLQNTAGLPVLTGQMETSWNEELSSVDFAVDLGASIGNSELFDVIIVNKETGEKVPVSTIGDIDNRFVYNHGIGSHGIAYRAYVDATKLSAGDYVITVDDFSSNLLNDERVYAQGTVTIPGKKPGTSPEKSLEQPGGEGLPKDGTTAPSGDTVPQDGLSHPDVTGSPQDGLSQPDVTGSPQDGLSQPDVTGSPQDGLSHPDVTGSPQDGLSHPDVAGSPQDGLSHPDVAGSPQDGPSQSDVAGSPQDGLSQPDVTGSPEDGLSQPDVNGSPQDGNFQPNGATSSQRGIATSQERQEGVVLSGGKWPVEKGDAVTSSSQPSGKDYTTASPTSSAPAGEASATQPHQATRPKKILPATGEKTTYILPLLGFVGLVMGRYRTLYILKNHRRK